ncbi:MAG: hypothetical protein HFI63_06155 [Lachnospiraceae bacterium]|nr:hypothetical protein [Lachnospiraceae bacterium]
MESVFAGYYSPLWERYHLLFMADGPGLVPAMEDILSYYEDPGKDDSVRGINLYAFSQEEILAERLVTAVDHGGKAFLEAVVEDMKIHGVTELAETFVGQAELVKEAEIVSGYIGSLSEYEEAISEIEENCSIMEQQGRRLKNTYESLEKALETGGLTEETGRELLEGARNCAAEVRNRTKECYETILSEAEGLGERLEKETEELEGQKGNVSSTSYGQMEAELENLKEYTREDGNRRVAADSEKELLEKCTEELMEGKVWEDGVASEAFREMIQRETKALQEFKEEGSGKKQKSALLDAVKDWKNNGILGLVVEDAERISDQKLLEGSYPSEAMKEENSGESATGLEKGAAVLYGISHFGRFGEEREDAALAYEVEYILAGSESDRENLTRTVERLLAVRSGMNFLYLLTDGQKQAEAELVAATLVGFTGIYPLVRFVKGILLGAWAFAEAICDLRILFRGGQVPLIKTGRDWKLSLEGAAKADSYETNTEEKGMWDYKGYLCILLLMGNTEDQCFRMMDLIEADLRRKDHGFFMENCIAYALMEIKFRAEPRFFHFTFPGVFPKKGYLFEKTAAYGYYDSYGN